MTSYWLLYRRLQDVFFLFFCAVVGANGDHQALMLHFLYMNKCYSQNTNFFVELYTVDSNAKLCQGGEGRYLGREVVPMDNSSGVIIQQIRLLYLCTYLLV